MDPMVLANAMIFADTINMQNRDFLINTVYSDLNSQQSLPSFYQDTQYYIPSSWYLLHNQVIQDDIYPNPQNPIKCFELMDGITAKTYAKCISEIMDRETLIIALSLNMPSAHQTSKIIENLDKLLQRNKLQTICYLVVYGACSENTLKAIQQYWKPVKPSQSSNNNQINKGIHTPLMFMRTRKKEPII